MTASRRQGVTIEDVAKAMRELTEEGAHPSVRQVRARIGRGSMTTITKFMEQVSSGIECAGDDLANFPVRLKELFGEIIATIDEVARDRVAAEVGHVEAMRTNVIAEQQSMRHERELLLANLKNEQQRCADMQGSLDSLALKASELEGKLFAAQATQREDGQLIGKLEQEVEATATENSRLKEYIQNYEAQTRQQIAELRETHAIAIGNAEHEVRNAKAQLAQANEQVNVLTTKLAAAVASAELEAVRANQNADAAARSEGQVTELQRIVAHLSVEEGRLKTTLATKDAALDKQRDKNDQMAAQLDELRERMISIQERSDQKVHDAHAEWKGITANMAELSGKIFSLALRLSTKTGPATEADKLDLKELGIAQKEIEALVAQTTK